MLCSCTFGDEDASSPKRCITEAFVTKEYTGIYDS